MCNDMRKTSILEPYSNPPGLRRWTDTMNSFFKMLPLLMLFMKYGKKTFREYIGQFNFKNPVLVFFFDNLFSAHDFSALAFIMMLAWFNKKNAGYLVGGSKPMTQRMTEKYIKLAGVLTTHKKVKKIIVEDNLAKGVLLDDGSKIFADYVISAADGHSTVFEMLEGKYLSEKIKEAYDSWELFNPIVQVSFGINSEIKTDVPVQSRLAKNNKIGMTKTDQGFSIMNYCFDPSMAPPGKTVIVIRYESQWDLWKDLNVEEYLKEKQQIENDAKLLLEKHIPEVSGKIEVIDVATPLTDVRYTGVWKGSYEGFLPSSKNLMSNLKPTLPGLNGFYMAGQWLAPGGGLPPAGQTGKWAIQLICKKEKKAFTVK